MKMKRKRGIKETNSQKEEKIVYEIHSKECERLYEGEQNLR